MLTSNNCNLDRQALSRRGLRRNRMFQSILFPVDFSDACKATAPYVRDLAELTGGSVTLLHVVPWRSAWYGAADVYSGIESLGTLRGLKKVQMSALARFRDECFNGVQCQIRIESGSVAEQIIDYAEHTGADLIMMPTHRVGSDGQSSIRSISAAVLREAPCAVWVSPHSDKLKPFTGFHSIVCAIAPDEILGEYVGNYVNEVTAVGAVFGSRVTFASAITSATAPGESPRVLMLEEEYPEAGLDQLFAGSRCSVYVEIGPVAAVVRHVAEIQSADLVVINRHRMPQWFVEFETHACEIILESPCPVLSLPMRARAASTSIAPGAYAQERFACAEA
jgi:nucleotide-binding universal stress UspA family protein